MHTARLCILLLLFVFTTTFGGCGEDGTTAPPPGEPPDTPATLAKRVGRTNAFALELFHQLTGSDDNLIVSPHSITTCFGMASAGARGGTERQMSEVLHFNYPQQGFHAVLKQLNDLLVGRPSTTLVIDNACWAADGMFYLPAYLDTVSTAYAADMDTLDFAGDPEGARQIVNEWVKDHTWGYIGDLFPPNSFNANTYLVLANAITFMAEWLRQFDPQYTRQRPFTRLDGSTVTADLMAGEASMPYYDGDGYTAMEMPYKGNAISMLMIVPDAGLYPSFESRFSSTVLDSIVERLSARHVTFDIPKFAFYSRYDLIPTLHSMGMSLPFIPGAADFSGMDGTVDGVPWISQVVHKAYVEIDEHGTIAFAGTGMQLTLGISDHLDATRPFIFVVRDLDSGTILFVGRVLDPSRRQDD